MKKVYGCTEARQDLATYFLSSFLNPGRELAMTRAFSHMQKNVGGRSRVACASCWEIYLSKKNIK